MKGYKMALPFIAGIAAGCLAVYAFNNKGKIKDVAKDGIKKGKDAFVDAKEFAVRNIEKITDKKEVKKPARKKSPAKKTTSAKKDETVASTAKPKTAVRRKKAAPKVEKEIIMEDNNE